MTADDPTIDELQNLQLDDMATELQDLRAKVATMTKLRDPAATDALVRATTADIEDAYVRGADSVAMRTAVIQRIIRQTIENILIGGTT